MMKLNATQVQEIRQLYASGFATRSIADAYGITHRQVWSIVAGRAWQFLPPAPVPLPIFHADAAARLRLRSAKRLSAEQREQLEQYRFALALAIDDEAEREGRAAALLTSWQPNRPRRQKEITQL